MSRSSTVIGAVSPPPQTLIVLFLLGATAALAGGFWDDAWHTERGRDTFFIAPHLSIYGGVGLAGAVLAAWTLTSLHRSGRQALRAQPGLAMALASILLTMASAPIDNAWHLAFGRDAVLWSPPHMLGIIGAMGLAFAALLALRDAGIAGIDARCVLASGLVLAAATFTVVEYETDVPQFSVRWYLPALVVASALAFALVRRAVPGRWAASLAAVAQLGFVVLIAGGLTVLGFEPPLLPLLLGPAVMFDLCARSRMPVSARALAHTASMFAVYVPLRAFQDPGLHIGAADLGVGLVVAAAGAVFVLGTVDGRRPARVPSGAVALLGAILVSGLVLRGPEPAVAHDPGQGANAGSVAFLVRGADRSLRAQVTFTPPCGSLSPRALFARRGGMVRRAPLVRRGCTLSGAVSVPTRGRWFIYMTAERDGRSVESWMPVPVGVGVRTVSDPQRFAYAPNRAQSTTTKTGGALLLYALAGGLIAAMVRLSRRPDAGPSSSGRQGPASEPV